MIRNKVRVLFAALAATAFILAGAVLTEAGTMYVCVSDMNFRSAGNVNASKIGLIPAGSVVEFLESSNGWDRVIYKNKTGWIHGGNLSDISGTTMIVRVETGYLALRTAKAYDSSNEIGELYSGDTVKVQDSSGSTYWYVYSPKLNKFGYVNRNYLINGSKDSGDTRTVYVASGYLALRTAMAYDSSNEIGELYTGDTVNVIEKSGSTYWYVYSPKLNKYGYVNKNYLSGNTSPSEIWTVSVSSGYLALRTAMAFDSANEIGQLYSGSIVEVQSKPSADYWYVYAPSLGMYGYVNCNYLI